MVDSTVGSRIDGPLGPCKTNSMFRSISNEKSRTKETLESELRVDVSRSEQTSPMLAAEPTSTWKGRSSLAPWSIVDAYERSAAVQGPDNTLNA